MKMHKLISLLFGVFLLLHPFVLRAEEPVNVYLFWGDGCPHCAAEREALQDMLQDFPSMHIREFEVYEHPEYSRLLKRVMQTLGITSEGIPLTVVGDRVFVGFSASTIGTQIIARIAECSRTPCPDTLKTLLKEEQGFPLSSESAEAANTASIPANITVPLLGTIDAQAVSLPLLALVMGVLDGFNPCALWTLLFLLSLLLGMTSRVRMWILGSTFIIASSLVYFLFMTAWLHLVLFLGFIIWVRLAIAAIALVGGSYSFYKGWKQESGCIVEGDQRRLCFFDHLKAAVQQRSFVLALFGIMALAFAVNLVELICSAGLPAVFTQVLALNDLLPWQSYALIALYIFFFMIDDLFVFFVTMMTLEMTGITTKYTRVSHLVGGALMVVISILLLFKPEWLIFG